MAITAERIDNHDVDFAACLKLRGTEMRHGSEVDPIRKSLCGCLLDNFDFDIRN